MEIEGKIVVLIISVILCIIVYITLRKPLAERIWDNWSHMGHMRYWWIFGFEWWGEFKPAFMHTREGKCYKPLFLGIWKRCKEEDTIPNEDN